MGKKLPSTPRSRVRSAIRQLWLRSRERQSALKRDRYTCCVCHAKQSRTKGKEVYVEVHHANGHIANWEHVIDVIFESILCDPRYLETLCHDCHKAVHAGEVEP